MTSSYGICRVVPPEEWDPPFSFPFDTKFPIKTQKIVKRKTCASGLESRALEQVYAHVDMKELVV